MKTPKKHILSINQSIMALLAVALEAHNSFIVGSQDHSARSLEKCHCDAAVAYRKLQPIAHRLDIVSKPLKRLQRSKEEMALAPKMARFKAQSGKLSTKEAEELAELQNERRQQRIAIGRMGAEKRWGKPVYRTQDEIDAETEELQKDPFFAEMMASRKPSLSSMTVENMPTWDRPTQAESSIKAQSDTVMLRVFQAGLVLRRIYEQLPDSQIEMLSN